MFKLFLLKKIINTVTITSVTITTVTITTVTITTITNTKSQTFIDKNFGKKKCKS